MTGVQTCALPISSNERSHHYRGEALLASKQYETAVQTLPSENLSHNIFHRLLEFWNSHLKQGELQQRLSDLQSADDSGGWRSAFTNGLIEFASFAAQKGETEDLNVWNAALCELFSNDESFSILMKLFDVLTRVKVLNDRKALLELPREERLLLLGNTNEEDFLNMKEEGLVGHIDGEV